MTAEEAKEDTVKSYPRASIMQIIEEMRQKADSLIKGLDDLTTNHLGMTKRAERKWQAKDLHSFADKLEKAIRSEG